MTQPLQLDFARNRAAQHKRRTLVLAILCLGFGLQLGVMVWRYQTAKSELAQLDAKDQQRLDKNALAARAGLSQEQMKTAATATTMLQSLGVPWESMLADIENARTTRVIIEAIVPTKDEGTVLISITSADFSGVADFIARLQQQAQLSNIMLLSETRSEKFDTDLRAVIQANWHHTP